MFKYLTWTQGILCGHFMLPNHLVLILNKNLRKSLNYDKANTRGEHVIVMHNFQTDLWGIPHIETSHLSAIGYDLLVGAALTKNNGGDSALGTAQIHVSTMLQRKMNEQVSSRSNVMKRHHIFLPCHFAIDLQAWGSRYLHIRLWMWLVGYRVVIYIRKRI